VVGRVQRRLPTSPAPIRGPTGQHGRQHSRYGTQRNSTKAAKGTETLSRLFTGSVFA